MSAASSQSGTATPAADKSAAPVLFQSYFKAGASRTYAAQVKMARNGTPFLVLTDGRRDPKTNELRKSTVWVFNEDFSAFFKMLHETAQFIRGQQNGAPPAQAVAPATSAAPARAPAPAPARVAAAAAAKPATATRRPRQGR